MLRIILTICITLLIFTPVVLVEAQTDPNTPTYKSIVEFPTPGGAGVEDNKKISAGEFVKILYALSISIAALLAVVKIIYAGVQYMLTDVVTSKASAKKDIYGAILGLVIVLSAVFILEIINPQLKNLSLFSSAPEIGLTQAKAPAVAKPAAPDESIVQRERRLLDEKIAEDKINGNYQEIVEEYKYINPTTGEEIPLIERPNYVDNIWPEQCEVDAATGEDNGNEFRFIGDIQSGVGSYACVKP